MTPSRLQGILKSLAVPCEKKSRAININCPFCIGRTSGRRDSKFRCGIFSKNLRFHCFRCKRTGPLSLLLSSLGISPEQYSEVFGGEASPENQTTMSILQDIFSRPTVESPKRSFVFLPPSEPITEKLVKDDNILRNFLSRRKISLDTCRKYGVRYTGWIGQEAYRLLLPICSEDGTLVGYQGRDITGLAKAKYLTTGSISNVLYRTDEMRKPFRLYVVEGIFDCWAMEYNAVATFTKEISDGQIIILSKMDPEELVMAWDSDAYSEAERAAREIAPMFSSVGVVQLPEGSDPDSLRGEVVRQLEIEWI